MLHLAYSLRELDFSALMTVYEEGNRENGDALYPYLSRESRLLRAERDFYDYLKEVFFETSGSVYAFWEVQGRMVSALRLEPYRDGYLLEALETSPAYRGKGYATALMAAFLQFARSNDKLPVYSHIRKGNVPSEKVHKKSGFRICKDLAVYIDGSVDSRCNTWKYV